MPHLRRCDAFSARATIVKLLVHYSKRKTYNILRITKCNISLLLIDREELFHPSRDGNFPTQLPLIILENVCFNSNGTLLPYKRLRIIQNARLHEVLRFAKRKT